MAEPRGLGQGLIGSMTNIDEPDVVVLAVEATDGGLVIQGEVVDAHTPGLGGCVLKIGPECAATICLAGHMADATGRQPCIQRSEMPFSDHDGQL